MPASEPIEGLPWLLWRPVRALRAPRTRTPLWVRSERRALCRIGGLWLWLEPGRRVPLLAPVDHPIPILACGVRGIERAVLRIASNLEVPEPAAPRFALDPGDAAAVGKVALRRARAWMQRARSRARHRPRGPEIPARFARPAVPAPRRAEPPARRGTPPPLAGSLWPEPTDVPRWTKLRARIPERDGRETP